jgi:glutathione synthase/RimK-type ligase-like ATP-grasp enzyme
VRVALATCAVLPRADADLPLLIDAFGRRGVTAEAAVWDDPAIAWRDFDAVIVRSTWDYVEKFEAFARWIDATARATRLLNDAPILRWNLHKRYLLELAARGVDIVPTTLLEAGNEADWAGLFARHGDLVLKPAVSAGSFATIRVHAGDAETARRHRQAHIGRDFLVQPLLRSVVEHGETNLVCFDGRPSHAIHKGARWSGESEQSRGLVEPSAGELALAERAHAAVRALGLGVPIYARVDCAAGPDGLPLLMELELLEPSLFLDRSPRSAALLANGVIARTWRITRDSLEEAEFRPIG